MNFSMFLSHNNFLKERSIMCKFPGKILMLAVIALLLSVGVVVANPASTDWNDSWGFPSPAEKSNLLNQALAIEFMEGGGYEANYYSTDNSTNYRTQNCTVDGSCFNGEAISIGSQVNIAVDGDGNNVNGNATTDGNTAAQNNNGTGSIDQNNGNSNPYN
jgi:hypothetical protein